MECNRKGSEATLCRQGNVLPCKNIQYIYIYRYICNMYICHRLYVYLFMHVTCVLVCVCICLCLCEYVSVSAQIHLKIP